MPNILLTNLASYRAYFQALATSHVDINGYKWGNADVIRNDNRSDLTDSFLWAMPYDSATYSGSHADNILKTKTARVGYMIVPASELFTDEEAAFDFCEAVIEQIIARINRDKRGELVAGEWKMLASTISSWVTGPIEKKLGSTRYIGWEMRINFQDNTNMEYNPAKWT